MKNQGTIRRLVASMSHSTRGPALSDEQFVAWHSQFQTRQGDGDLARELALLAGVFANNGAEFGAKQILVLALEVGGADSDARDELQKLGANLGVLSVPESSAAPSLRPANRPSGFSLRGAASPKPSAGTSAAFQNGSMGSAF